MVLPYSKRPSDQKWEHIGPLRELLSSPLVGYYDSLLVLIREMTSSDAYRNQPLSIVSCVLLLPRSGFPLLIASASVPPLRGRLRF